MIIDLNTGQWKFNIANNGESVVIEHDGDNCDEFYICNVSFGMIEKLYLEMDRKRKKHQRLVQSYNVIR